LENDIYIRDTSPNDNEGAGRKLQCERELFCAKGEERVKEIACGKLWKILEWENQILKIIFY